jgi:hypothetical protein
MTNKEVQQSEMTNTHLSVILRHINNNVKYPKWIRIK